jgi:hypothetical protein
MTLVGIAWAICERHYRDDQKMSIRDFLSRPRLSRDPRDLRR